MTCLCVKLCECIPIGDLEEKFDLSIWALPSHWNHVHWSYAGADPAGDVQAAMTVLHGEVRTAAITLTKTYQDAFNRVFGVFQEKKDAAQQVIDFFAELEKRRRSLAVSQGRSPDHGPPCPPTPYRSPCRSDIRTSHHARALNQRAPARR